MKFEDLINNSDVKFEYRFPSTVEQMTAVSTLTKVCVVKGTFDYFAFEIWKATWLFRLFLNIEDFSMDDKQFDTLIKNGVYHKFIDGVNKSNAKFVYRKFVEICDNTIEDSKSFVQQMSKMANQLSTLTPETVKPLVELFKSKNFVEDVAKNQK